MVLPVYMCFNMTIQIRCPFIRSFAIASKASMAFLFDMYCCVPSKSAFKWKGFTADGTYMIPGGMCTLMCTMCTWTSRFLVTCFTFQNYTLMYITMVEIPPTYCGKSTVTCTHFTLEPIPWLPLAYTMPIYIKSWFMSGNVRGRRNWGV